MSRCPERAAACLLVLAALSGTAAAAEGAYPGLGRPATPQELRAWDIDVRPDFKGLPPGSGSVAQGQLVWESRCASCHGVFGEANHVFAPLVGGTTADDVETGRVALLKDSSFRGRTTLMRLATVSTLWDYIHRAMPWTAPKTLATDEVYAVVAYMLHLGGIVSEHAVLSHTDIAEVQQRMPNRLGMQTDHGLWPGRGLGHGGRPDVRAPACVKACAPAAHISSVIPESLRNDHGNLAAQQRGVGPQRGVDTTRPAALPLPAVGQCWP